MRKFAQLLSLWSHEQKVLTCRGGNGGPQFEYNNTYSTYPFTAHAVSVIEKLEADTPLFLYMPYQNVHWPLEAPQEFMDMFAHIPDSARQVSTQRKFSGAPPASAFFSFRKRVFCPADYLSSRGRVLNVLLWCSSFSRHAAVS